MTLKYYSKATLHIVLFYNLKRSDPENLMRFLQNVHKEKLNINTS